ncbi:hypothetical protein TRFO_23413 [Tritrichomonas foetus]|uniref:Cleavage/polyadenylation specificity factor A subunit C-terminal domain-containing protein n=1 Tax=Tritrichomonas foetus TaxID=1144522 RepID=A0A1J4KAZ8_9EUKA|nr:hypothetical protein TRFO_23413 [Tritrichomonas foetus]|eukprot:OHT08138.1 hypothetical protein TRFO_23413 [Tritrichomonas foetus]
MESRKVGYILQPLVEGSTLSNSIKCKLPQSQKPCFVFAKRRELIFFEITENGISPLYKVPFAKTIASLRILTSKSLGKPQGSDLIVVYFHDFSFVVFSDPKHIKFQFNPPEIEKMTTFICETHHQTPILLTHNKSGLLSLWNAMDNPKIVYNINCSDQRIVDLKFLSHQSIRLIILYDTLAGLRSSIVYTLNKRILVLEEISRLSVRQLSDASSSLIIPFPHGDSTKPVYLIVGREKITIVYKNQVDVIDTPFDGDNPKCICELGGWSSLIATSSGSLYGIIFDEQFNIFKIGELPILPTSITKIDGDVFFIGSSVGDSIFVQLSNTSIHILSTIEQFTPVNSFSTFCENVGSIFLTQGNEKTSSLSTLKTGASFSKEVELHIPFIESIFFVCDSLLVISLHGEKSVCISLENYEKVQIDRFIEDCQTLNALPRNESSFYQVCSRTIRAVGKNTNDSAITYDSDIVYSTTDGEFIILLFNDNAEIVTMNLEPFTQIHFNIPHAFTAALYQGMIAVAFYSGEIQLHSTESQMGETKLSNNELITYMNFNVRDDEISLIACSENGTVFKFDVPDLFETERRTLGYHIKSVTQFHSIQQTNKNKHTKERSRSKLDGSLLVNGTSPVILYPNGSFISVICENYSKSCSLNGNKFALANDSDLFIGTIENNSLCSITQKGCISQPLHFSIHQNPLSLFVSFEKNSIFTVSSFVLPSFSESFSHILPPNEEVTALYYHNALNTTFFGVATHKDGSLHAVKELFGEFKIVHSQEIKGSVFCISSSKPNNLIIGGSCKLYMLHVEATFSGMINIETIQVLPTEVIPRSISILGPFIIYFGANKAITIMKESSDNDGSVAKYDESIIRTALHSGFLGKPVSKHTCHIFTADENWNLNISSFRFKDDFIEINQLTSFKLDSPVSAFHSVRDGYAMVSTRNGGLYVLQEYDREKIGLMKKVVSEIAKIIPCEKRSTKIVDGELLEFFAKLPEKVQTEIAGKLKRKPREITDTILGIKSTLSKMCSTL